MTTEEKALSDPISRQAETTPGGEQDRIEHLNRVLRSIRDVNKFILKMQQDQRWLQHVLNMLIRNQAFDCVWIALFDADENFSELSSAGIGEEAEQLEAQFAQGQINHCAQRALQQPNVVIVENTEQTCGDCPLVGKGPALTVRLEYGGKIYGVLSAYPPKAFAFHPEERQLIREVSEDIAFAFYNLAVEEELRVSEERFRSLYESMIESVCLHEMVYDDSGILIDHRIVDVNPRYEHVFGVKKDDVVGKLASQVYAYDQLPYLDVYAGVAETGQSRQFEAYFPPLEKHFIISVFPIGQEKFASVFADITKRKLAQQEQDRLASYPRNNPQPVVEWDLDCNLTYLNPAAHRLADGDHTQMIPADLPDAIEQLKSDREENMVIREIEIGGSIYAEYIFLLEDEARVRAYGFDITELKETQNELARLASYPKNNPQPILEWDLELRPTYLNPAAREFTKGDPTCLTPDDLADVAAGLQTNEQCSVIREIEIGDSVYAEYIYLLESLSKVRAYGYDITELKETQRELEDTTIGVLKALSRTVEAKDEYTGEHINRVQHYALRVGQTLGLPQERLEQLLYASELHDVGKVMVPDHILGKPAELTSGERSEMQKHAHIGEEIVGQVGRLKPAAKIIGQHHEVYDGTGYPAGLEGDEITLEARIISVVDAWDAMRTDRTYRKALPRQVAIEEIKRNSGSQFDPQVVEVFLGLLASSFAEDE